MNNIIQLFTKSEDKKHKPLWHRMKNARYDPNDILQYFGINVPEVCPYKIAKNIEVEVIEVSNPGWDGALQSNLTKAIVWLKQEEHPVLKRFTLAHELGHLFLHKTGTEFTDLSFSGSIQETEANFFAINLLCPFWMLDPIARYLKYDVEKLCKIFLVTKQAMINRLQYL